MIIIEQNALLKRLTQQTPTDRTGYRSIVICYATIKRRKERARKTSIAMSTDPALKFLTYQTQNKAGYSGIYRDNKTQGREHPIGMLVSEETVTEQGAL